MQATAVTTYRTPYSIWESSISAGEAIGPLVELALTQTNLEGAYVYRFDRENSKADVVASVGRANSRSAPTEIGARTAALHWDRNTPVVIGEGAANDWRFAGLPEFLTGGFEGVVSVPLLVSGAIVGMANFCRVESRSWGPRDLAFLLGLSLPLGALLTASSLRAQLQRAEQLLADRKLLERAKGLLQARLKWSEEEAYLHLRRLSRQRRTPLREIALEVIEAGAPRLADTGSAGWKPALPACRLVRQSG